MYFFALLSAEVRLSGMSIGASRKMRVFHMTRHNTSLGRGLIRALGDQSMLWNDSVCSGSPTRGNGNKPAITGPTRPTLRLAMALVTPACLQQTGDLCVIGSKAHYFFFSSFCGAN